MPKYKCRSRSYYDWWSVSLYALVSSRLSDFWPDITSCLKVVVLSLWDALSDERTGLQFAVQSVNGPSSAEPVTILYFLIWDSSKPGGPVPVFISPRNRVTQLYPRGTGFPLPRLLRLAGLRWRYSNPPPHGDKWREENLESQLQLRKGSI
jgi:hypothetical protein